MIFYSLYEPNYYNVIIALISFQFYINIMKLLYNLISFLMYANNFNVYNMTD